MKKKQRRDHDKKPAEQVGAGFSERTATAGCYPGAVVLCRF